jgi:hypothetical protein
LPSALHAVVAGSLAATGAELVGAAVVAEGDALDAEGDGDALVDPVAAPEVAALDA